MKKEIVYKKIKEILKNGCLTVSLLINELLKQKVFSNRETARTNIFRLLKREFLASSKPITFLDQGFAIATNDINLASNCKSMILNNYTCFNSVVKALDSLGQISYFELEKIFVLKRGDINSLLKIIKSVQYIYNCQNDQTNKCLKSNYENIYDSAYVSLKKHLTSIFINYLQEINLIYGNKIEFIYKDYIPKQLKNISFDMYTDSNIYSFRKDRAFLVLDIGINREYSKGEFEAFKRRINQLHKSSYINVIPFIICDYISEELMIEANKNKIGVYKFKTFFGSNYRQIINDFYKIDQGVEKLAEFENTLFYLKSVSLFDSCKGYLFEYFCFLLIKCLIPSNDLQKIKRDIKLIENNICIAQFDILFETKNEICLCECKSSKYPVGMGKETTKDSFIYFAKQVEKYDKNKKCNSKMLFFSANGFKKNINEQKYAAKTSSLVFQKKPKICISKFDIKNLKNDFYRIWNTYFINENEQQNLFLPQTSAF